MVQARAGGRRGVGDLHLVTGEHLTDVRDGLRLAAVGGEPVVHRDRALIRDDVARDPAGDPDRVQPLVVDEPVHLRLAGLVGP